MPEKPQSRRQLLRDTVVFQFKLFVDGLRDLVLSPVSLIAALLDLLSGSDRFYRLLDLGRQSERWINLFGTHDEAGLDEAVTRVENLVREQYSKGNMSAAAKEEVDRALDDISGGHAATDQKKPPQT